jgi:hypothetical protein
VHLELAADELRPIVKEVFCELLKQQAETDAKLGERLGYSEAEAAAALGIAKHRLRDARLRGEISAKRVGRSFIYSRQTLVDFLENR